MQLQLPDPGLDAQMASRALQTLIANDIRHNSGWIPFSRFMELALYAPGLGYYSGGAAKLGRDGDFTTAPEMSPLFGQFRLPVATDDKDKGDEARQPMVDRWMDGLVDDRGNY